MAALRRPFRLTSAPRECVSARAKELAGDQTKAVCTYPPPAGATSAVRTLRRGDSLSKTEQISFVAVMLQQVNTQRDRWPEQGCLSEVAHPVLKEASNSTGKY